MDLLSTKELQKIISSEGGVPQKGGQKDYAPDGSWMDKRKLEMFHEDRRSALAEERVRIQSSLMTGEWLPEKGRVEFPKQGRFSKYMGYAEAGKEYLLPEEAMYLLDEASIQIYYKGVPLSIQEALIGILMPQVPLEHYEVFSYFSRIGYVLRRYLKPHKDCYEDKINLSKYSKAMKRKNEKVEDGISSKKSKTKKLSSTLSAHETSDEISNITSAETSKKYVESAKKGIFNIDKQDNNEESIDNKEIKLQYSHQISQLWTTDDIQSNKSLCVKTCDNSNDIQKYAQVSMDNRSNRNCNFTDSNMKVCQVENNRVSSTKNCEKMSLFEANQSASIVKNSSDESNVQVLTTDDYNYYHSLSYSNWNFEEINFPDISQSNVFQINQTKKDLLPSGIQLSSCECDLRIFKKKKHFAPKSDLEFSFGAHGSKAKRTAKNWAEYKQQMCVTSEEALLLTSPAGHLWTGDVTPLIKPQEAFSTETILEKLKVIQNSTASVLHQGLIEKKEEFYPNIVYDGYEPSSKFKKSNPGKPHFRLVIMRQNEPPPSLRVVSDLCAESVEVDNVPLYWAVVDSGDISFYSLNPMDLPHHISMG